MKLSIRALAVAVAAVFAFSAVALAAVEFDPEDGTGFVGKGDVQQPFGWNNKQMNDNAADVSFFYQEGQTVEQDCVSSDGGAPPTFTVVGQRTKTQGIDEEVEYEKRRNGGNSNLTGFILLGYDEEPEFSEGTWTACPAGSTQQGQVRVVSTTDGGLFAKHGSISHLIWNPDEEEE
jgi:opacity protein-like surface antigen